MWSEIYLGTILNRAVFVSQTISQGQKRDQEQSRQQNILISAIRRAGACLNGSTENGPETSSALSTPWTLQGHVRISVNYFNIYVSQHVSRAENQHWYWTKVPCFAKQFRVQREIFLFLLVRKVFIKSSKWLNLATATYQLSVFWDSAETLLPFHKYTANQALYF